jgi:hypothetical protein
MIRIMNRTNTTYYDGVEEIVNHNLQVVIKQLKELNSKTPFKFNYTSAPTESTLHHIELMVIRTDITVEILPWWPFNRWTKAIGMTTGGNKININMRKIRSLSKYELADNVVHETMHLLGYGHGSNKFTPEKVYSAPYGIGYMVEGRMKPSDMLNNTLHITQ